MSDHSLTSLQRLREVETATWTRDELIKRYLDELKSIQRPLLENTRDVLQRRNYHNRGLMLALFGMHGYLLKRLLELMDKPGEIDRMIEIYALSELDNFAKDDEALAKDRRYYFQQSLRIKVDTVPTTDGSNYHVIRSEIEQTTLNGKVLQTGQWLPSSQRALPRIAEYYTTQGYIEPTQDGS